MSPVDKYSDFLYILIFYFIFFLRTRTKSWLGRRLRGGKCSVIGGVLRINASRLKFLTLSAHIFPASFFLSSKTGQSLYLKTKGKPVLKSYTSFMFVQLTMEDAQILKPLKTTGRVQPAGSLQYMMLTYELEGLCSQEKP